MNNKNCASKNSTACDVIASHIDPFIAGLKPAGYAANTISSKRAALGRFISWRRLQKHPAKEPDESQVIDFLKRSPQQGSSRRCIESAALSSFLEYLRRHAVITTCIPKAANTVSSAMERRYADFLRNEKGLAELSLLVYLPVVDDLLDYLKKKRGAAAVRRLDATMLRAFLFERARDRSSEQVRLLAISLRSFLRFLHAQGDIRNDLTAAIPTVRKWKQPDVPKKLTPAEVCRILDAPDRKTATGRRDYAILLLLAKLGLRSSEVISLELGDIRWRTGEILIRGKGTKLDILPLPRDVGAAMANYLHLDRGVRTAKRVFLRTHAPRVPLTGPASIGHIVRHTMVDAGVERPRQIAAHLFRHYADLRTMPTGAQAL